MYNTLGTNAYPDLVMSSIELSELNLALHPYECIHVRAQAHKNVDHKYCANTQQVYTQTTR